MVVAIWEQGLLRAVIENKWFAGSLSWAFSAKSLVVGDSWILAISH